MNSIELPKFSERRKTELDDFVFTSRVRLSRNIDGLAFPAQMKQDERYELENKLSAVIMALFDNACIERIEELEQSRLMHYISNHVLTRDFITRSRILIYDKGGDWVILLNEDDHLKIFSIEYGFAVKPMVARIIDVIDALEKKVDFTYNEKLGYLTASVLNVGTGLRLSVLINLYGLVATKRIENFVETIQKMGYSLINLNPDNPDSALFYLYNVYSLGLSEDEMIADFKAFLQKAFALENEARAEFFHRSEELEICLSEIFDIAKRDTITWAQMLYYISLGDALNRNFLEIKEIETFRNLIITLQDDYLIHKEGIEKAESDRHRAKVLKNFLSHVRYKNKRIHAIK